MSILDVSGIIATARAYCTGLANRYKGTVRGSVQLRARCRLRRPLPAIAALARTPDRQRLQTPVPFHLSPSPAFPPPGYGFVVLGLVLGDLLVGQRHVENLVGHPADVLVYD